MAVAVSEASARVGVGFSIMLSIICVAITCEDSITPTAHTMGQACICNNANQI